MDDSPDDLNRRLAANQPPAGEVIRQAIAHSQASSDVELAGDVLAALQRHYELRPR